MALVLSTGLHIQGSMMLSRLRALFGSTPPVASGPDGCCVYAIGDIHGERRLLDRAREAIRADAAGQSAVVVFLGDYIDRGPDSRGVLDCLSEPDPLLDGVTRRYLLGNHEQALLDFLDDPEATAAWLDFGGIETLISYGVPAHGQPNPTRRRQWRDQLDTALPDRHRAFLSSLETMVTLGDYAFVHAGVRPGVAMDQQSRDDLLWIREPFLSSTRWHGRRVVHGHTVTLQPDVRDNRIGIDTGAYASGRLTVLAIEGPTIRFLDTVFD